MNELCEVVFSKRRDIFKDRPSREHLVDACQRVRWMSVREVTDAFSKLPNFSASSIPTEAVDMGRPAEPPAASSKHSRLQLASPGAAHRQTRGPRVPKVVIF